MTTPHQQPPNVLKIESSSCGKSTEQLCRSIAAYEQDDKDDKVLDLAERYFLFLTGSQDAASKE